MSQLKLAYKFINFQETTPVDCKTKRFACFNTREQDWLGDVLYYSSWRQYCFQPSSNYLTFSAGCLADIQDFIGQLTEERKACLAASRSSRKAS